MSARAKRSPLPPLVQNLPSCPLCNDTVLFDDGWFRCTPCGAVWESDRYDEEGRADELAEQCTAEVQPYLDAKNIAHYRYRCVRDADHPKDRWDYHIGARSDGGVDYDGMPLEWRDGDHPPWLAVAEAAS